MESPLCRSDSRSRDTGLSDAAAADPAFRLIETFGYSPGAGIARTELHLARMATSASSFGMPFDQAAAQAQMASVQGEAPLRCRMTLARDGTLALETAPMPAPANLWHFAIAPERLDPADPFLRHKTTRRALYDRARAHLAAGVDELVFLNTRGEVCEGTITNIIIAAPDGPRLTPPMSSGCLPGVFRQSCLDAGALREAVLTPADLAEASGIWLTNALRGAISATWHEDCAVLQKFRHRR
ncbi:aminotransferase class IV family protein [Cribrihabitans neustonicus]|uniref:aminotransferase class IV family protein n=1 Tax=Cribrihabitans neustonicus TaxID=1429085 RepID=UPI003B5901E3